MRVTLLQPLHFAFPCVAASEKEVNFYDAVDDPRSLDEESSAEGERERTKKRHKKLSAQLAAISRQQATLRNRQVRRGNRRIVLRQSASC